jgi:hypothetical protein
MDIIIHGLNFEYVHWQFGGMVVFLCSRETSKTND